MHLGCRCRALSSGLLIGAFGPALPARPPNDDIFGKQWLRNPRSIGDTWRIMANSAKTPTDFCEPSWTFRLKIPIPTNVVRIALIRALGTRTLRAGYFSGIFLHTVLALILLSISCGEI